MALGIVEKIGLLKEVSQIADQLKNETSVIKKLPLLKRYAEISKQLGGKAEDTAMANVDKKANQAATSPKNDLPQPTEQEKETGTYRKGKVKLHGLDILIENPKGSTRAGTDPSGNKWTITMKHHYGEFVGTKGADGDQIDVFIGNNPESEKVFVIDQVDPTTGEFDEHKVMLGFTNHANAKKGYQANYESGWQGLGAIKEMKLAQFKAWVTSGTKNKPISHSSKAFNSNSPDVALKAEEKGVVETAKIIKRYLARDFNSVNSDDFGGIINHVFDAGLNLDDVKTGVISWLEANPDKVVNHAA